MDMHLYGAIGWLDIAGFFTVVIVCWSILLAVLARKW